MGGDQSTQLGYEELLDTRIQGRSWWWCKLWKIKEPYKSIFLMCLGIDTKVHSWEVLMKRNKIVPDKSLLCKD